MTDLSEIKRRMGNGEELEDALRGFDWKGFEKIVAEILQANGYETMSNFRFKTDKGHEIDVVAHSSGKVICVDCKEWNRGRRKKHALVNAADKQKTRTEEFSKFARLENGPVGLSGSRFFPMIVTLFEEDIQEENGVMVVPVWKLNSFLNGEFLSISN